MSNAEYEFAPLNTEDWTFDVPRRVGKYQMRCRGKTLFNSYYYGDTQTFEIAPKPLTIAAYEDSIIYGDEPTINVKSMLAKGDRLDEHYSFDYRSERTAERWNVVPKLNTIRILDNAGTDVTACYAITVEEKTIDIAKRTIYVTSGGASKDYDGTELYNEIFTLSAGRLAYEEHLELVDRPSILFAGEIDNGQTYRVKDEEGRDMTHHYDIHNVNGKLTINKRPITLTSPDKEIVYDATDQKFSLDDIELNGSLAIGEYLEYEFENDDPFVDAGEYVNSFKARVMRGEKDYSENYDITLDFGKTTIAKRPVKFKSHSGSKTYDKSPLSVKTTDITEGSLAIGHRVNIVETASITDSGEIENTQKIIITDGDGNDFTKNYDITQENGSLTVNPIDLEVTILPLHVTYDGKPHANSYTYDSTLLAGEDALSEVKHPGKTDAGTYDVDDLELDVLDENGVSNKKNYNVTFKDTEGALIIDKRPITVDITSHDKTYNALPIVPDIPSDNRYSISDGSLAEKEYVEFVYKNDRTDAGSDTIQYEVKILHTQGDSADPNADPDVTKNYNITVNDGTFTVNKRSLQLQTLDVNHVYDRSYNYLKEAVTYQITSVGDGLVEGHQIKAFDVSCPEMNVGTHSYTADLDSLVIEDASGNDVTANYNVSLVNSGAVTITKRPITVTLNESKVYDGKAFPKEQGDFSVTNLLSGDFVELGGHTLLTWVDEGIVHGNTPDSSASKVYMADSTDVTANYAFAFVPQDNHIEPRPITLASPSYEKTFDGQPFAAHEFTDTSALVKEGSLAEGDRIVIDSMNSLVAQSGLVHVGMMPNAFSVTILNGDDRDVTSSYDINHEYGTLEVKPFKVHLHVAHYQKIYDGVVVPAADLSVNGVGNDPHADIFMDETLPDGFTLNASLNFPEMKYAGKYEPSAQTTSFFKNGNPYDDVSDFDVIFDAGQREILAISLEIAIESGVKFYDGEPYASNRPDSALYSIKKGALLAGHRMELSGPIVRPVEKGTHHLSIAGLLVIYDENDQPIDLSGSGNTVYSITYSGGNVTIL